MITIKEDCTLSKSKLPVRLHELRENSKMTQQQVAEKIGIATPTISCYEKGTKKPSTPTLIALADLFHTTTDYLLGRSDAIDGSPATEKIVQEVEDFFETKTKEEQKRMIDALKLLLEDQ